MSKDLILFEQPRRKYDWATEQEVLEALEAHMWNIGHTARYFGVKRRELAARIAESPDLQLEREDYRLSIVDNAETRYIAAAEAGKFEAVTGVLNQLGRDRGWGKQDRTDEAIEVVIRQISKGE